MLCTYRLYLFNMYCTTMYFDHINRMNICFKFVFLSSHSIVLTFQWSNRRINRIYICFSSYSSRLFCLGMDWVVRVWQSLWLWYAQANSLGGQLSGERRQTLSCVKTTAGLRWFWRSLLYTAECRAPGRRNARSGPLSPFLFLYKDDFFFLNLKFKMCVPSIFYHECTGLRHLWICSVWHTK